MGRIELHWLDPHDPGQGFPDPQLALEEPNGLLAVGGDLSTLRLLNAYDHGIFPWYNPDEPILWWSPDPRTVFLPDGVHVSRSLRRHLSHADYAITLDVNFGGVLQGCSAPRANQHGTWLGTDMRRAYRHLHHLGHAHSVEVWQHGRLVGGLYGVSRGRAFFGESMFSAVTNASKVALVWLTRQLWDWGFALMDAQVGSPHLYRMGATDLPRPEFQELLAKAVYSPAPRSGKWAFTLDVPAAASHLPDASLRNISLT